jgi:hypothetical protein
MFFVGEEDLEFFTKQDYDTKRRINQQSDE